MTFWNASRTFSSDGSPASVAALKIKLWLRSIPSSALVLAETTTRKRLLPAFNRLPSLVAM